MTREPVATFPRPTPAEYVAGFDQICDLGLGPNQYLDRIERTSKKEARRLWRAVVEAFPLGAEDFTPSSARSGLEIVASDSLSGGPYPCSEGGCRSKNAELGARFAALYADHIVIRDPIGGHYGKDERNTLRAVLPVMYVWRPLFEAGLASHVARICGHCAANRLKEVGDVPPDLERLHQKIESQLARKASFTATRYDEDDDDPYVAVEGPSRYFQHGGTTQEVGRQTSSQLLELLNGRLECRIPIPKVRSLGLLRDVARPIVSEFLIQQVHRSTTAPDAHYASNIPVDLELAAAASAQGVWPRALLDALTHSVPVIGHASVSEIVRFRLSNPGPFHGYRQRVSSLAKFPTDTKLVREAAAELREEYETLEHAFRRSKDGLFKKTRNELILVGSIGVALAGILPPVALVAILGTLGGPTLREAVRPRVGDDLAKTPLYFLWRFSRQRRR